MVQLNLHRDTSANSLVSNNSVYLPDMDKSELRNILNDMSSSKPPGHDNISKRLEKIF